MRVSLLIAVFLASFCIVGCSYQGTCYDHGGNQNYGSGADWNKGTGRPRSGGGLVWRCYSHRAGSLNTTNKMAPTHQEAGRALLDENFLKGGVLQRDLSGDEQPQESINVETGTEVPRFATREFTVHAGNIVSVTLNNNSKVGHSNNWVLVKPGTAKQVQEAAQKTPQEWNWIPETPNVLAFVPLTKPGAHTIRLFRAPSQPGDYPFLCTYADRGAAMNGILHVIE